MRIAPSHRRATNAGVTVVRPAARAWVCGCVCRIGSTGDYSGSASVLDDAARTPVLIASSETNAAIWLAVPVDRAGDPFLTNWT